MKKVIITFISICCLIITTFARAAVITINLNEYDVPSNLECNTDCLCDTKWVESNITLHVTAYTSSDPYPYNLDCDWSHGNNIHGPGFDQGILLHPGRLIVDLDDIDGTITKIEVILEDYYQTGGCSSAAIYQGSSLKDLKTSGNDYGPINTYGSFTFDQTSPGISAVDKLIVASCDGHVGKIVIYTTSGSGGGGGTSLTCGSGWGCGSTLMTCGGGWGCGGSTLMTCGGGLGCGGSTLMTCGGGWGCGGGTLLTCGSSWGCGGGTSSTCGGGWGCGGSTLLTCGGGCNWFPLTGSSFIPSLPPAF